MAVQTFTSKKWLNRSISGAGVLVFVGVILLIADHPVTSALAAFDVLAAVAILLTGPNRVDITDDIVVVRNGLRTHRVERSDIDTITYAPMGWFSPACAALVLTNGKTVRMFSAFGNGRHPDRTDPLGAEIAIALGYSPEAQPTD